MIRQQSADGNGAEITPPTPQRLVIWRLFESENGWRRAIAKMPYAMQCSLFDHYYDLAEDVRNRRDKVFVGSRVDLFEDLMGFAWRINDLVVEHRHDISHPNRRRLPPYAAHLRASRRRGLVPARIDDVHVSVGFAFNYQSAAFGAFIVAPRDVDPYTLDFSYLVGLDVRILATAADWRFIDPLARVLAFHGVRRLYMRRLDKRCTDETLYKGDRPWRL